MTKGKGRMKVPRLPVAPGENRRNHHSCGREEVTRRKLRLFGGGCSVIREQWNVEDGEGTVSGEWVRRVGPVVIGDALAGRGGECDACVGVSQAGGCVEVTHTQKPFLTKAPAVMAGTQRSRWNARKETR